MMRRLVLAISLLLLAAQGARSESQRALFTRENKFPELGKAEVGGLFQYSEFDASDRETLAPYARYAIIKNVTLNAALPYHWVSPEFGDDEAGVGDAKIGAELLAYQDIFDYPWVIPHVDIGLETGDEDKGLGAGATVTTLGISVGTTVYDQLHYVGDVSYAINGGTESEDPNNAVLISGSIIWDVSEQFAVLGEGRIIDEENSGGDATAFWQGGMVYKFTESLTLGAYLAAWSDSENDTDVTGKLSYTF